MKTNLYRVTLEKVINDPEIRNPFAVYRCAESFANARSKLLVRTWEFEAKNEKEVRGFFEEAKKLGEPQVQGMSLRKIEKIS